MNPLTTPLSGIRIVDLTSVLFGPYATQMLADFGADVIKVEAPEGDPTRHIGPRRHEMMSAGFLGINRNKRSLVLDLKQDKAKQVLWRLIETADVFVHNIRPQKIAKLGFSADQVMRANTNLVYGALHGYLETGLNAGKPAYDDVIQGGSGVAAAFLARDGKPAYAPSVIADKSAGLVAANALTAALFQRLRQQQGVYVEVGMFESMVAYTLLEHQFGLVFSPADGSAGYSRVISPQRKPYATANGYICMLAYTDKQWQAFWKLADAPQFAQDERFASMSARTEHTDVLYETVGDIIRSRSSTFWLENLSDAEIPCGPINTFDDLMTDEHLQSVDFFRPYDHPTEGQLYAMDTGIKFNRMSLPIRHHQPRLGEHSVEILEELGFDQATINGLTTS